MTSIILSPPEAAPQISPCSAGRLRANVALLLLALAWGAGCGTTGAGSRAARPLGGLVIRCDPAEAKIFVDDQYLGHVSALSSQPLQLPAGLHRVELRLEGYFPHFTEVTVGKGVRQKLAVKLRKEPF